MACPACAAGGVVGGYIGGYFGINQPENPKERLLSGVLSSTLTLVTVVGLRVFFNKTLCGGDSQPAIKKFCRLVAVGLLLGIVYSIAINYALGLRRTPSSSSGCGNKGSDCHGRCGGKQSV